VNGGRTAAVRALALVLLVPLAASAQSRTLAVSYFDVNATDPELQVLKKGLADMLISDLSAVKGLQVVEREKLNSALDELKLAQSPFVDPKSAVKLGKGLSATHMLTGSLTAFKGKLRISARVFDVQTSQVMQGKDVEGEVDDFFGLEKELVELLVAALELKPDVKEKAALRKSQTESLPALKSYAKGLDQLDRGETQSARDSFEAARSADPNWKQAQRAIDSLKSAIGKVEAKREGTLQEKLAALRPDDPDLYEKLEKLSHPQDLPYSDRDLVKLTVLEHVAKSGLKPWKKTLPRGRIGDSTRRHWEAHELERIVSAFGGAPQSLRTTPVLLEYLARKYSDDPSFLDTMENNVTRSHKALEKADLKAPIPEMQGSGEYVDRHKIHYAFLTRMAEAVPLPRGLSRNPLEAQKRLEELLEKEKVRRRKELESEFERRIAALDPKDPKLNDEINALQYALQEERGDEAVRVDAAKKRVRLARWLLDHPEAKPFSGTAKEPHYSEVWDLLGYMSRFDKDPSQWDVIPGAGEYLLKKYPDTPYVVSQLKLHLRGIEENRKEDLERMKKRWAEEQRIRDELKVSDEVRALFTRAGELARKMK
jgi:TolB-like protein